jgi:hypothetical protein
MTVRGEPGFGDDDRLPWLETVEDDYREGPSAQRVILLVLLLLAVIAAASFGYYWYQQQRNFTGTGELINAQEGDYKVKPENSASGPAAGEGDSVYPTSEGATTNATIDTSKAPEEPIEGKAAPTPPKPAASGSSKVLTPVPAAGGKLVAVKPQAPSKPVVAPTVVPTPAATASSASAPAASNNGAMLQLGSFPSEASANTTWTHMSKRFGYLAPLGHVVERAEVNGKTVFRLRVTAGTADLAKDLCGRLKVAGESCFVAR